VKAKPADVQRALSRPADTRLFLFHGPDEAGSRGMLRRLAEAMGADAERIDLRGAELKEDPARLADEAAAISMFGGARWILVEQAGDESLDAVEALLDAPVAGNPVAIVAGALKPASKLLKAALAAPNAVAFASYLPEARDADRIVLDLARDQGLIVRPDVAHRIAEASGANRSVIEQELAKYALYLDASPEAPKPLDHDAVDAVGSGADEGSLSKLVNAVVDGDAGALEVEIARLGAEGRTGIGLTRPLITRLTLLARMRADVEQGKRAGGAMASSGKPMFWRDEKTMEPQVRRWRSDLLAKAISRLVEAERQVMSPGGPGDVAADAELFAICRQAARLR
jgi:DNA polymerase-3 subunit delta